MRKNNKIAFLIASATIVSQIVSTGFISNAQSPENNSAYEINNQEESYKNEIELFGVGYNLGYQSFKLKFDTKNNKLIATDLRFPGNGMHPYFKDNKYIELQLIGKDGKVKDTFSMTGNDKVDKVEDINAKDRFNFEYGDYLKIYHAEADWRTKISGTVQNDTSQDYSEKVSNDTLNNSVFKITENGLKQVKIYENEIELFGVGYTPGYQSFKLKFDTENKKIVATDLRFPGNGMHPYFKDNKYIELQLIGKDGKVKDTFSMTGNDKVDKVKDINSENKFNFEYGDYLKIYHAEADWRTKISGTVQNATSQDYSEKVSNDTLNNSVFKITENGLKQVKIYENEIELFGVGYTPGYQSFKLKFDTENKKVVATDLHFPGNAMHSYFKDNDYIKLELIGENGEVKATFSMTGNDKVDKVKDINAEDKFNFEYGDKLRIYHAEADWRTTISGTVQDATSNSNYSERVSKDLLESNDFEITENGLKLVKSVKTNVN